MTAICFTIERDLKQYMNEAHQAETVKTKNEFYML